MTDFEAALARAVGAVAPAEAIGAAVDGTTGLLGLLCERAGLPEKTAEQRVAEAMAEANPPSGDAEEGRRAMRATTPASVAARGRARVDLTGHATACLRAPHGPLRGLPGHNLPHLPRLSYHHAG